jgi:hypothetical protein
MKRHTFRSRRMVGFSRAGYPADAPQDLLRVRFGPRGRVRPVPTEHATGGAARRIAASR